MKRTVLRTTAASFLLALVMCSAPAPSRTSERSADRPAGPPAHVTFVSDRDGNREIYVMNVDGSGAVRLTNHDAKDSWPAASPDGKRIVFTSERDQNSEIYVVGTDGSGLARLTNTPEDEAWPAWSPDGKRIAFQCQGKGLFTMAADGSDRRALTSTGLDGYPTWIPGGEKIVFHSWRDGGYQFYEVNADGTGLQMLDSGLPPSKLDPRRVLGSFVDDDLGKGMIGRIHLVTQKDGIVTFENAGSALGEFPRWSPDGSRIAFHSTRDGNEETYVMRSDRSGLIRLTNDNAPDMFPSWCRRGDRIVFHSFRDGNLEIYAINPDGSGLTRVTNTSANEFFPSCSA